MKTKKTELQDLANITALGQTGSKPNKNLETFPNHHSERDYQITITTDEFTCLCPATGQPDYASITIIYTPDEKIVESKSLKLYLMSYRDEGIFHEHLSNIILDDLLKALEPRQCQVIGQFKARGGISIKIEAEYKK